MKMEPMMWSTVRCAVEPKEPSGVPVSVQCLVPSTSHEGPSGPSPHGGNILIPFMNQGTDSVMVDICWPTYSWEARDHNRDNGDQNLVKQHPYNVSPERSHIIEKECQEKLQKGRAGSVELTSHSSGRARRTLTFGSAWTIAD